MTMEATRDLQTPIIPAISIQHYRSNGWFAYALFDFICMPALKAITISYIDPNAAS